MVPPANRLGRSSLGDLRTSGRIAGAMRIVWHPRTPDSPMVFDGRRRLPLEFPWSDLRSSGSVRPQTSAVIAEGVLVDESG